MFKDSASAVVVMAKFYGRPIDLDEANIFCAAVDADEQALCRALWAWLQTEPEFPAPSQIREVVLMLRGPRDDSEVQLRPRDITG